MKNNHSPMKPIKRFSDISIITATLPQIDSYSSTPKTKEKPLLLHNKYRNYQGFHSLDNLQSEISKSLSPKKLPPLKQKINENSKLEENLISEKFQTKIIINKNSTEFSNTENHENLIKNAPKKSVFSGNMSKCPFAKSEVFKEMIMDPSITESPTLKTQKDLDFGTLEKLWKLFSSSIFSYIMAEFEQRVKKVAHLSKYFKDLDISKTFHGKLDFFRRNIGKTDMTQHNRFYLETIHKKMNIPNDDFDVFKGFFAIVMREHMIEEDLIADFLIFLEHFRKDIVSKPNVFQKAYSEIPEFEAILIESFREKINNNQNVNKFFAGKDSDFQRKHCKIVINFILNGKNEDYDHLRTSHQNCQLTDQNFYNFKQCLIQSLQEFQKFVPKKTFCPRSKNPEKESYFTQNDLFDFGDILENTRLPVLNQQTYFDSLSEAFKFEEIVTYFMKMVSQKPLLNDVFQKYSEKRVRRHAEMILTYVLGGPTKYSRVDMTPAHYKLDVSIEQFEETRKALEETFLHFNVNKNDMIYILSVLDSLRHDICNEKPLIQKIGGTKTIDYVVNHFYLKSHKHPQFCEFFKNANVKNMIANQKFWLAKFLENSNIKPYHFKDLRSLLIDMGITKEAYNYFIMTLAEGLKEYGHKDENVIREALDWLKRCQNDILNLKNE